MVKQINFYLSGQLLDRKLKQVGTFQELDQTHYVKCKQPKCNVQTVSSTS
jgi:hypothetical protein